MGETITCKNCSNHFSGKFCNICGEKVYSEKDKSVKHFFEEIFHFITHFDSKFFKTLLLIFKKPGTLSLLYCNGIRSRFFKPTSLFLIGIVIYLLFPVFQGLNLSFRGNITNFDHQYMHFISSLAEQKAAAKQISMAQLGEKYDHLSPKFAKVLLLILLPLTGLALQLLFRKKRGYYFDHLVLATEANNMYLYFTFFIMPLLLYIPAFFARIFNFSSVRIFTDTITIPLYLIVLLVWSAVAFKTFYKIKTSRALLKGLLFLLLHSIILYIIYRVILFLIVLLFI